MGGTGPGGGATNVRPNTSCCAAPTPLQLPTPSRGVSAAADDGAAAVRADAVDGSCAWAAAGGGA
jgi:hypothetical protein